MPSALVPEISVQEAERSIEAQGRVENLQELVGSARNYDEQIDRGELEGLVAIGGVGTGTDAPVELEGLARLQAFLEGISLVTDLDENDPRSMARWARKMGDSLGEDMGDDFNEMIDRMEAGEMPDDDGGDFGGGGEFDAGGDFGSGIKGD